MIKLLSFSFLLLFSGVVGADTYYPSNIIQMDNKFSHHVILVEKASHSFYLYQNNNGVPELIKTFRIATGKSAGNKTNEGDKKTPEGIYQLMDFYPSTQLMKMYGKEGKIYGAGAFTTNYPNIIDTRNGKGGSGIWLHSTDDDSRIEKGLDSKGCVVVVDKDLKEISQYIDLMNASMIIVHDLHFWNEKTWKENKNQILTSINNWRDAWREENIDAYMEFYHPEEFKDNKGNYNAYKAYKKAVFANPGKPQIDFTNISILLFENYVVVQMEQRYISNTINDSGKKVLFLKKNHNYEWKIVAELWGKIPATGDTPFTPQNRYFKD